MGTTNSTPARNFSTWIIIMIKGIKIFAFKEPVLSSNNNSNKNRFSENSNHLNFLKTKNFPILNLLPTA